MRKLCTMYRLYATMLIAIISVFGTTNSHAWKIDLHVWIAQNIVNDISDGSLDVNLGKIVVKFPAFTDYLVAVNKHPDSFLLGSIGPDAFPDAYTGQSVVHSSAGQGWGTSEWLQHLAENAESDSDLAFVLGYHIHAATDVFAHTFANRYAGDVFDPDENEWASTRHIYLESFVSNYLPPLLSSGGGNKGSVAEVIRPGDKIEIPEQLILNSLLLNEDAHKQYKISGGSPHLAAANDVYSSLVDLLADDGAITELETLVPQALSAFYPEQDLLEKQAEELRRLRNMAIEGLQDDANIASEVFQDVINDSGELEATGIKLSQRGLNIAFDIASEIETTVAEIASVEQQILEATQEIRGIRKYLVEKVIEEECRYVLYSQLCDETKVIATTTNNPLWHTKNELIVEKRRALDSLIEKKQRQEVQLRVVIESGFDLLEEENARNRLLIDQLVQVLESEPFGPSHQQLFSDWRDSLPPALTEFSRASVETIVNTIDPEKPDVAEPMQKWFLCYGGAFTAVPAADDAADCVAGDTIQVIREKVTQLEQILPVASAINEDAVNLKNEIEENIVEINKRLWDDAITSGLKEFEKIANSKSIAMYKGLTEEVDIDSLNDKFSSDPSDDELPIVPEAGERLISEMQLRNGGRQFDPRNFNALYNSIVLSKLTLLDKDGLNELSTIAELSTTLFGDELYGGETPDSDNILYGFLRNTNGNHQWHDLAPPHPRKNDTTYDAIEFNARATSLNDRFGYVDHGCTRSKGMRMWVDPVARELLFKRLFKGNNAAGIDAPDETDFGFETVLEAGYPDLFSDDSWSSDALNYHHQNNGSKPTKVLVSGIGVPGYSVEFFVGGSRLGTNRYDTDGNLEHSLNIPGGLLPNQLVAVVKDTENNLLKTFHRFSIGCEELPPEFTIDRLSDAELLPGETMWELSARLTGLGKNYWRLFSANKDLVKDPFIIFPEQVVQLPWIPEISVSLPKEE